MAGMVLGRAFQRAWVSGGSRGIGLGIATRILEESEQSKVWLTARTVEASPGVAQLRDRFGSDRVACLPMDITDQASVDEAAAAIGQAAENKLDAVINTVGILHDGADGSGRDKGHGAGGPEKRLRDVDARWALHNFNVNAVGPLLLAQAVVERNVFDRDQWTCLANLSAKVGSISDNRIGAWYSYRASKAAQNMITRCVAIELGRMKRKVVCVGLHPGTVDTSLSGPFSKSVNHEIFSVEKASTQLMTVLHNLDPQVHNGNVLNWDGSVLPA